MVARSLRATERELAVKKGTYFCVDCELGSEATAPPEVLQHVAASIDGSQGVETPGIQASSTCDQRLLVSVAAYQAHFFRYKPSPLG